MVRCTSVSFGVFKTNVLGAEAIWMMRWWFRARGERVTWSWTVIFSSSIAGVCTMYAFFCLSCTWCTGRPLSSSKIEWTRSTENTWVRSNPFAGNTRLAWPACLRALCSNLVFIYLLFISFPCIQLFVLFPLFMSSSRSSQHWENPPHQTSSADCPAYVSTEWVIN